MTELQMRFSVYWHHYYERTGI